MRYLKKYIFIALIFTCSILVGCNSGSNNENTNSEKPAQNTNTRQEYTAQELEDAALNYYQENSEEHYRPGMVASMPDEENPNIINIQLYDNLGDHNSTSDWYSIDKTTGKGTNILGEEIDLTNYVEEYVNNKVKFVDGANLAIAYIIPENEKEFKNKYFTDEEYNKIDKVTLGNETKFIVVPKYKDAEITVKSCYLGEDGMMYEGDPVIEKHKGPLCITSETIEFIPKFSITYEYKGELYVVPVGFSGMDETMDLGANSDKVMDISIYLNQVF